MKETLPKSEATKILTRIIIFTETFLVPFIVMILDIVTDVLVVMNYAYVAFLALDEERETFALELTNYQFTESLSYLQRFCYSLAFLLIPWFFYALEFINSPMRKSKTAERMNDKNSCFLWIFVKLYIVFRSMLLIIFWPIAQLLMKVTSLKL